jgi:hypothetical protein
VQNGLAIDVLFGLANEFRLGVAMRLGKKKKFGIDRGAPNPYDIPVAKP